MTTGYSPWHEQPNTINICKSLLGICHFIRKMANAPSKFLVFTGKLYESSICSFDLLRSFARSNRKTRASCFLHDVNVLSFGKM
ncbi:hypothetical protein VP01_1073g6 [Puccinia sorghi]|uniref:Uncharacterized protein n=1 Tax=Puccinia sorghi TaxID=27349 RepID=A0A0L6VTL0_9BASI|nr:hypothetical protein VP01_1073g6 [Puccinia sorghi]